MSMFPFRKSMQPLMSATHIPPPAGQFDIYPSFPIGSGRIELGFDALARQFVPHERVIIDSACGMMWNSFREQLARSLAVLGVHYEWLDVSQTLKPQGEIDALVVPFLGGDDPLFGTRFTKSLDDFFDVERLAALREKACAAKRSIVYGCGAALISSDGLLVYADVPKNEAQFRFRAGSATNLGVGAAFDPKLMYKRSYFVDWPALRGHQRKLLPRLDLVVDAQRPGEPATMTGNDLRHALGLMSQNYFRVRPWFEPGPWGGQWMKSRFPALPQEAPNLAWSFELITPENGLVFESDGQLLEVSFDFLMFHDHRSVLGDCADRFAYEFPIRFDYLDTFAGGNLSVQCHPRPAYMRKHFGEKFTQDETYYISDCAPDAQVYLGFRDGVDPKEFKDALEQCHRNASPLDVERFVNREPAQKHCLYLIPNGTIHCSGTNNLVLEISATPYIFTFKMYDWMRLDLDGHPRPLNIERAMDNLYFDRAGERVRREFVSQPTMIAHGDGWQIVHLPTHVEHFYDVHRFEFTGQIEATTDGSPHVLNLVGGESIILETANGLRQRFNYAETFVVPAAAGRYRLLNEGATPAMAVKAFVKVGRGKANDNSGR
jgi:mannose-6-phosphate isomerase class I